MSGQRRQPERALRPVKWVFIAFVILVLNSGYLAGFAEPTLFYMLNVMLHVVLGTALVIPFFIVVRRFLDHDAPKGAELAIYMGRLGYWCLAPCLLTGLYLVVVNATHSHRWILYFHITAGFVGVVFFQKAIRSVAHKVSTKNPYDVAGRTAWVAVVIALCIPILAGVYRLLVPGDGDRIVNPIPTLEKPEEPGKPEIDNPFAPSAASTPAQKTISSQSFLNSASCSRTRCHPDIYQQWQSSAHHYSSFNNPWYRKSIEHLLETSSAHADSSNDFSKANPAKWCGGCHDPALLVSGKFEQPVQELAKMPEAHAGVSCTVCHSMVRVNSTRGQADYVLAEMSLNGWANNENKLLRGLYDFLLRADPEPHRRSMMKSFHSEESAEFCSSCHKAHMDKPVNHFRWMRSFNDYDSWQAGPFSGRNGRGIYSAREGKTCVDCHMPRVEAKDASNGKIHSHRFLGANTALPVVNQDQAQLRATAKFLRDRQVSVDIFALGRPYADSSFVDSAVLEDERQLLPAARELAPSTLFAVGDEQRIALGTGGLTRYPSAVIAPLKRSNATVRRGENVRIDVVVRSRRVGHFFPSGTVDAQDVWLELQAYDNNGQVIFWSGGVANNGKGSVDSSAHFYRSYLVDGEGNYIDKNNTWAAREAVYVNLIPPGGADVAHYRLSIPSDCGDKIQLIAKLNYRKFNWRQTQWSFSGSRGSAAVEFAEGAEPREEPRLAAATSQNHSGHPAPVPEVPVIEMARDEATLAVIDSDATQPPLAAKADPLDAESWNDYGMGMLRQGDLKSAEAAFLHAARLAPNMVDAWINVSLARLQEGNPESAMLALEAARKINASSPKVSYYFGLSLKTLGQYDNALKYLKRVVIKFPRDRIARNERGHLYLLMKDYPRAIADFEKVLGIDPENVEAYFHLKNAYGAVGEEEKAKNAANLYERFRGNESSFMNNVPADSLSSVWRERRPIHEHVSAPLVDTRTISAATNGNAHTAGQ